MKQLLSLLLAVSCFSVIHAQSSTTEKAKRVIRNERRDYDPNSTNEGARDVVVGGKRRPVYNDRDYRYESGSRAGQINREYDAKIRSIRNNPTLSRAEKDRIIRGLEAERVRRIREADGDDRNNRNDNRKYAERSREDRRYDNDNKKYKNKKAHKSNNGKHLGWQKGKGNPHQWN